MDPRSQSRDLLSRGIALVRRDDAVNWALIDQALVSGVNFLTTILVARSLGVESFGRFALAWLIVQFAASVHASFIIWPMMSLGPKQRGEEASAYFAAVVAQHAAYSILTLPVLLGAVALMALLVPVWRLDGLVVPIACATLLVQCQDALRRYYFTQNRGLAALLNDAIRYLGQLALLAWAMLAWSIGPSDVLWMIAASALVATLVGLPGLRTMRLGGGTLRQTAVRHWRFGKWLCGSSVVAGLSGNIISFATGAVLGTAAIGAVHSSYTILGLGHIVHFGLANVTLVRASALYHGGGVAAMMPFLWRIGWLLFGLSAALSLVAAVAPRFWLELFLGPDYGPYGHLLVWWAVIVVIESVVLPLESGLRAMERTRPAFMAELWRLLAAVVLLYPLITWFGLGGVMACFLSLALVRSLSLSIALHRCLRRG